MHFFVSHLASWLRTRRFSEPIFDPPEPQIIGKTQCFATFLPFHASASSFFLLFFLLIFLFSQLSASSLLCFSSVHIVGSLTSKLPSIILYYIMLCYVILYYIYIYFYINIYIILYYILLINIYIILYYIIFYYTLLYTYNMIYAHHCLAHIPGCILSKSV